MKNLLLIFSMVLCSISIFASPTPNPTVPGPAGPPPACVSNPAAGNTCATATPICDLNGYCGSTASTYTADYWSQLNSSFCGSIENNSFLTFVASSTSISFNVWVSASSTSSTAGIQIMVFSANNCSGAVTNYACWSPGNIPQGSVTFTANGLTAGNTYYIMIDGNGGAVCDYVIGANSGILTPVSVSPENATLCLGQTVNLSASGGDGNYTWDASPDLSATTGANVTASPPSTAGVYTYSVSASSGNILCPSVSSATATITVQGCGCMVTAANSGPVCPGASVNLTATDVPNGTYSWTGPNGYTSSSQNPVISPPTTPGTYDYTVNVSCPDGTCSSTTTVTVKAVPVVTAVSDISVCNNTPVAQTIFASTPTGATFDWTNSDAATGVPLSGTGNVAAFTPNNTTAGPLQSTITVTPTLSGCIGSPITYTITVAPTPTANAVTPMSQCHGLSIAETVFSSTIPGVTYAWTNSNAAIGLGASGSGNLPAFTAANTGSTPVVSQITVTPSLATCAGTAINFTITVNPLPVVEAGNPQTVCAGTSITLAGSGAVSYTWDNGISDNTAFPASNTQSYTVTGTDANGCINTDNVTITVFPYPTLDAGADQSICIGASVTLTGTGSTNITWNNNVVDGVAFTPTATQTYTLTATDANNCQSTDQVVVTVNPLPNINAGADQNICFGTSVILSGTGGVSYQWTNNATNGQAFQPAIGTNNYTVTGTDINGCQNTDAITITVLPVAVSAFETDKSEGYPILSLNFTNTSTGATSYMWNFGDGSFSSSNQSVIPHQYSTIGNYEVTLITSNGICSDTSILEIIVYPYPSPEIIVPNVFTPNGDQTNELFWIDVRYAQSIQVQIYNRWGNLIHEMKDINDRWDGTVNGNAVSDGVYFHKYTVVGLNGESIQGHGNITIER